jgi:hypothetical protein
MGHNAGRTSPSPQPVADAIKVPVAAHDLLRSLGPFQPTYLAARSVHP